MTDRAEVLPATSSPVAPEPRVHLGLVAYVWGALHQDRLLIECLAPAVEALGRQGLAHRFWWDRYDARGPHIFSVLTLPRDVAPEAAGKLSERLGHHLASHPSSIMLTTEQLARRHQEVRQKRQCEPDGRPGFAANNSFEIFDHPLRGYPFSLSAHLAGEEELWNLGSSLSLWAIGRLADRPGSPAMAAARHWIASLDRELRLAGVQPVEYWRYTAQLLIPDLLDGMGSDETDAVLAQLAVDVGTKNPALAQAWQEVAETGSVWPGLPDLIRLVLDGSAASPAKWSLLREINHFLLKQLGVPVAFHLPLALYAWQRNHVLEKSGESAAAWRA